MLLFDQWVQERQRREQHMIMAMDAPRLHMTAQRLTINSLLLQLLHIQQLILIIKVMNYGTFEAWW